MIVKVQMPNLESMEVPKMTVCNKPGTVNFKFEVEPSWEKKMGGLQVRYFYARVIGRQLVVDGPAPQKQDW